MNYLEKKEQLEKQINDTQESFEKKMLRFLYALFGIYAVGASFTLAFNSITLFCLTVLSSGFPLTGMFKNFADEKKEMLKLMKCGEQLDIEEENRVKRVATEKKIKKLSIADMKRIREMIINEDLSSLAKEIVENDCMDLLLEEMREDTLKENKKAISAPVIESKTNAKSLKKTKSNE